jgi:hypothetical protein
MHAGSALVMLRLSHYIVLQRDSQLSILHSVFASYCAQAFVANNGRCLQQLQLPISATTREELLVTVQSALQCRAIIEFNAAPSVPNSAASASGSGSSSSGGTGWAAV